MSFLVWANTPEAAERRVRVDNLRRDTTQWDLDAMPVVRHGPMTVRLANDRDLADFATRGAVLADGELAR